MAITVIQEKSAYDSNTATATKTLSVATTTTANALFVIVQGGAYDPSGYVTSISVSPGSGTFTSLVSQLGVAGQYGGCEIWWAPSITGGTNPTVTINLHVATDAAFGVIEAAGLTGQTDGGTGSGPTQSNAASSGNITTTNNNDLLVGGVNVAETYVSGDASWTNDSSTGSLFAYRIVSVTGTYACSATLTGGYWTAAIAALKGAANLPIAPKAIGTITGANTTLRVRQPIRSAPSGPLLTSGSNIVQLNPQRPAAAGTIRTSGTVFIGKIFPRAIGLVAVTKGATFLARSAQRAPTSAAGILAQDGQTQPREALGPKSIGHITSSGVAFPENVGIIRPRPLGLVTSSGTIKGNLKLPDQIMVLGPAAFRLAQRAPLSSLTRASGVVQVRLPGLILPHAIGAILTSGLNFPHFIGAIVRPNAAGTIHTDLANTLSVRQSTGIFRPNASGPATAIATALIPRFISFQQAIASLSLTYGNNQAKNALRLVPSLSGSSAISSVTSPRFYRYPQAPGLAIVSGLANAQIPGLVEVPLNGAAFTFGSINTGLNPINLQIISFQTRGLITGTSIVRLTIPVSPPPSVIVSVTGTYVVVDYNFSKIVADLIAGKEYAGVLQSVRSGPHPDYFSAMAVLVEEFYDIE